jgi:hypothetical protein
VNSYIRRRWRTSALLRQKRSSPLVADDAFASVAAGDAGELALEGAGRGPAIGPFPFGGDGGERDSYKFALSSDVTCQGDRIFRI